jgi:hypothetical protein
LSFRTGGLFSILSIIYRVGKRSREVGRRCTAVKIAKPVYYR